MEDMYLASVAAMLGPSDLLELHCGTEWFADLVGPMGIWVGVLHDNVLRNREKSESRSWKSRNAGTCQETVEDFKEMYREETLGSAH